MKFFAPQEPVKTTTISTPGTNKNISSPENKKENNQTSPEKAQEKNTSSEMAIVAFPVANLLSEPKKEAKVVGHLKRGDKIEIIERKDSWLRVVSQKDGKKLEGWLPDTHVIVNKN